MTRKEKLKEGMRFHWAHATVGKVVAHSIGLSEIPLVKLKQILPLFGSDISNVFGVISALKNRRAPSPENMAKQIAALPSDVLSQ
jgi:argininosuccinate lyase